MKITVETCCGIAFANGKEEPAKGQWGRDFTLLQHAIRHERVGIPIKQPRHLCAAGRDRFQFNGFEVSRLHSRAVGDR